MTTITINGQEVEATRIDGLDQTVLQSRDHVVPAMREGVSVRLSVAQILSLLISEDMPDEAVTEAKLAEAVAAKLNGALQAENDLSDVVNAVTARTNIGAIGNLLATVVIPYDATVPSLASSWLTKNSVGSFTLDRNSLIAAIGVKSVRVRGVAGGGGGGGAAGGSDFAAGAGGGAGAPFDGIIGIADLETTETLTVGQGGAGGTAGDNNGSTGGTTSFGSHMSGTGGSGGNGNGNAAGTSHPKPGDGGNTSYGSNVMRLLPSGNRTGATGHGGLRVGSVPIVFAGHGGNSIFGAGGRATNGTTGSNAGAEANSWGGGGGGGRSAPGGSSVAGGNGGPGAIILEIYG